MVATIMIMSLMGAMGALVRYGLTRAGNALFKGVALPVATLFINLLGAFCLGLSVTHFAASSLAWQISSGFLGGMTTFSTFTNEVVALTRSRRRLAAGYLLLSTILGVGAAALGIMMPN